MCKELRNRRRIGIRLNPGGACCLIVSITLSLIAVFIPVLLMGGVYATVLGKLKKDPLTVIRKRLSLSTLQKMLVVGTRMLRPHFV